MDNRLKCSPGIYLIGFMASGKTTIAQVLADRLGWDCVDLDTEIEAREQTSIAEIFDTRGEAEFRRIEAEVLNTVVRRTEGGMASVIALGGGSFVQPCNALLVQNHGISIWLDCPLETIEHRIAGTAVRPLARDPESFRRLYEERREAYTRADYRVDANCDVERTVDSIMGLPFWK
jgi:shikimate kinase